MTCLKWNSLQAPSMLKVTSLLLWPMMWHKIDICHFHTCVLLNWWADGIFSVLYVKQFEISDTQQGLRQYSSLHKFVVEWIKFSHNRFHYRIKTTQVFQNHSWICPLVSTSKEELVYSFATFILKHLNFLFQNTDDSQIFTLLEILKIHGSHRWNLETLKFRG